MVDETDRILEVGYEDELRQIMKLLPYGTSSHENDEMVERQTMLFSATQTDKVEDINQLSVRGTPVVVSVEDVEKKYATVEGLEQVRIHGYHY